MYYRSGGLCAARAALLAMTMAITATPFSARAQDAAPARQNHEMPPPVPPAERTAPVLTWEHAIAAALEHAPALSAATARMNAASAARTQATALPNPELSIEAGNIFGDGPYDGMENAEITYGISQQIVLPGKQSNRRKVATAFAAENRHAQESARLDLIHDITIAFAAIAAAQDNVAILEEEHKLAAAVHDSVAARVDAGREPPIQAKKARIAQETSRIALERARRDLIARKKSLTTLMVNSPHDFSVDAQSLPPVTEPAPPGTYQARLTETPDMKIMDSRTHQAGAALSLEKAYALPDPTLHFGIKDIREDDSYALVAGVSFPIPVFDLNRAAIRRAGYELNAARHDRDNAAQTRTALFAATHADLSSAYLDAEMLRATILPGAEDAFRMAHEGYKAGKFGYLDVLDAQRTLFEARRQLTQAVLDYQRQNALIDRMTARLQNQFSQKDTYHE